MSDEEVKEAIKKVYTQIAKNGECCCCGDSSSSEAIKSLSKLIGYPESDITSLFSTNLGLGCGTPVSFADIKEGAVVLDLGCGAGLDCFLAAGKVGKNGRVVGFDMTPAMIDVAKVNAEKNGFANVEFQLGDIENLLFPEESFDNVISNCVINLAKNKKRVFEQAYKALCHGGQLTLSDIVLTKELPKNLAENIQAYVGCISGAQPEKTYLQIIEQTGFQNVETLSRQHFSLNGLLEDANVQKLIVLFGFSFDDLKERIGEIEDSVVSITVSAVKP